MPSGTKWNFIPNLVPMNTTIENGEASKASVSKSQSARVPSGHFQALAKLEQEYYSLSQMSLFVEMTKVEAAHLNDLREKILMLRSEVRVFLNEQP